MSDEPPTQEQWQVVQQRCLELSAALRAVLELVDRAGYMTHARQLVLREAETLVKP